MNARNHNQNKQNNVICVTYALCLCRYVCSPNKWATNITHFKSREKKNAKPEASQQSELEKERADNER